MTKIKKTTVLIAVVTVAILLYLSKSYFYWPWSGGTFPRTRTDDSELAGRADGRGPALASRQERPAAPLPRRLDVINGEDRPSTLAHHKISKLNQHINYHHDSSTAIINKSTPSVNESPWRRESTDPPTTSTMSHRNQWIRTSRSRESTVSNTGEPVTPDPSSRSQKSATVDLPVMPDDNHHCTIPQGGYKSWNQGVITVLKPTIQRNCTKLFAGDQEEAERIKNESVSWKNSLSDRQFLRRTRNCSWLREELENNLYNTKLEREFPMAYIFVINSRPQSVFRNLKLLFRPQNTFCINFDTKSTSDFKEIFKNIDSCFDNIMISSKQENVRWGFYTIMEAQLNCHYDLLKFRESQPLSKKWRYVVNLCGKELPLMSPHKMVSRLSMLNGSSSILPRKMTSRNVPDLKRIEKKVKMSWWYGKPIKTNEELGAIPFNLSFYKSSSYSILSPKFVRFLLLDPVALEVHYYFTKSMHSEEHLYATLFMMPGAPGGYDPKFKDFYVRAAHSTWTYSESSRDQLCHGIVVNSICIITAGDLPMVMRTSENRTLFHNKYLMDRDHTAMDCLEEVIVEKNKREYERECL